MRVRCKDLANFVIPPEIEDFHKTGQFFLTSGKEYLVMAVSIFESVHFVLICDDDQTIQFEPLLLFDVIDRTVDPDWICSLFPGEDVSMVIGPEFLAKDLDAHTRMVDHEVAYVTQIWEFYEKRLGPTGD